MMDAFKALCIIAVLLCVAAVVGLLLRSDAAKDAGPHIIPPIFIYVPGSGLSDADRCRSTGKGCRRALATQINADRAAVGAQPLALSWTQSKGTATCSGSQGHSAAMEKSGAIWHYNPDYERASFDNNFCIPDYPRAQNVGEAGASNKLDAILTVHHLMLQEPWTPGCLNSHRCALLSPMFHQIGIGLKWTGSTIFLTEDLTG